MTVLIHMIRRRGGWMLAMLSLMFASFGTAQTDTLTLSGVEVSAAGPQTEMAGVDIRTHFPKRELGAASTDIGRYLMSHSDLDLRSYGPGGSVALSMRGSSTSQVQVTINGIPFEMPSLAMVDLSILPVAAFGKMSVYRGSAAAYLGNAAVGGSVMLDTRGGSDPSGVTQSATLGSFGAWGTVTDLRLADERLSAQTTVYQKSAENDFRRPDPYASNSFIRQSNAAVHSRGWVQNFTYLGKRTRYAVFLWADQTDREIPAVRSRAVSEASQRDRNMRVQGTTFTDLGYLQVESAVAYDQGVLNFADPASDIEDHSYFSTVHARLKAKKEMGSTEAYIITDFRDVRADTETYSTDHHRSEPSVTAGVHTALFGSSTRASVVVRQAWLNGKSLPILPVVGVEHRPFSGVTLSATVGRTFRLPGLNDLFWSPGGNPDLKPESGWFQEAAMRLEREYGNLDLETSLTGFHRMMENRILWRPGPSYWAPVNLQSVRSYGLEGRVALRHTTDRWKIKQEIAATYVRSQSVEEAFEGDRSAGKQLIYVPPVSGMWRTEVAYRDRWQIAVPVRYKGRRYTTADHRSSLDPYLLFDVEAEYRTSTNTSCCEFSVFGAVRNVFDRDYQIQTSHYMPGRYFEAGLRLHFGIKT